MKISADKNPIPIARDHGRGIGRKTADMISNALLRTISSDRLDCASPAALTPSQIPYVIAPAIGMKNVASAQYLGDRRLDDLMVDTAFSQDAGVGNGGGMGSGNGGAATDGAGGGGTGTVEICGGSAAGPKVVIGNGWVGISRGVDGGSPSGNGVHGCGRSGNDAPTWL